MIDSIEALNASMETVLALTGMAVVVGVVSVIEFELTVAAPKAVVEEEDAIDVVDVGVAVMGRTTGVAVAAAAGVESLLR
jgi:hypothetical protein